VMRAYKHDGRADGVADALPLPDVSLPGDAKVGVAPWAAEDGSQGLKVDIDGRW